MKSFSVWNSFHFLNSITYSFLNDSISVRLHSNSKLDNFQKGDEDTVEAMAKLPFEWSPTRQTRVTASPYHYPCNQIECLRYWMKHEIFLRSSPHFPFIQFVYLVVYSTNRCDNKCGDVMIFSLHGIFTRVPNRRKRMNRKERKRKKALEKYCSFRMEFFLVFFFAASKWRDNQIADERQRNGKERLEKIWKMLCRLMAQAKVCWSSVSVVSFCWWNEANCDTKIKFHAFILPQSMTTMSVAWMRTLALVQSVWNVTTNSEPKILRKMVKIFSFNFERVIFLSHFSWPRWQRWTLFASSAMKKTTRRKLNRRKNMLFFRQTMWISRESFRFLFSFEWK